MYKPTCIFHAKIKHDLQQRIVVRIYLRFPLMQRFVNILIRLRELYMLPVLALVIFCICLNVLKNVAFFNDSMWVFSLFCFQLLFFILPFCMFIFVVFGGFFSYFLGVLSTNFKQKMLINWKLFGKPLSMFIIDMYLYLTMPTISPL